MGFGFILREPTVAIMKPDMQRRTGNPVRRRSLLHRVQRAVGLASPSIVTIFLSRMVCVNTEHE